MPDFGTITASEYLTLLFEWTKHVTTISVSLLVLIPTFLEKAIPNPLPRSQSLLRYSIFLFALAVVTSVATQWLGLGSVRASISPTPYLMAMTQIRITAFEVAYRLSWLSFGVGVVGMAWFILYNLKSRTAGSTHK